MNADEQVYTLAHDILQAQLGDRFSDFVGLLREAVSIDPAGVLAAMAGLAAAPFDALAGHDRSAAQRMLRDNFEAMRQLGALEFPEPFAGL